MIMDIRRAWLVVVGLMAGPVFAANLISGQTGACCAPDGACSLVAQVDCAGDYLGDGTSCYPNCCPQTFHSGGPCCRGDEYRCTGGELLWCDPQGDPADWPPGCDTCELVCSGPVVFDIQVPGLDPPGQVTVVDITSDASNASGHATDECSGPIYDGLEWYQAFRVDDCAVVTWTFCCNEAPIIGGRPLLSDACSCPPAGPVNWISPNPGRSGFGDACGNNHCCSDGNYSVEWTVRPGESYYLPLGLDTCEGNNDACTDDSECEPGLSCQILESARVYQAHIYVEPCQPAACCFDDKCQELSIFECEDQGGNWLGALDPPVTNCSGDPCSTGVCCHAVGPAVQCDDDDPDDTLAACDTVGGDYHGGLTCPAGPCAVCESEDSAHCQLGTGYFPWRSDRNWSTRLADDFRPTGNIINRVCFEFGFGSVHPPPNCADDPPSDNFEVRFYEDAFGIPGAELLFSPGPVTVDRRERKDPDSSIWRFSAPIEPGVQVIPGDCYWMEITGMGNRCSTYWVESVDGNNYGMRDRYIYGPYGPEDAIDSDVAFCIDTGIVPATEPGIDGGCGGIPVACCLRDYTCQQLDYQQCTEAGSLPFVYGDCSTPDLCPFPRNDYCHIEEDPPNPDRPPTGAFTICEGDPERPELGEWIYWDALTPETRLGECEKWPGYPAGPVDFGQVCYPLDQTSCTDPPNIPYGNNICWPWGFDSGGQSNFQPAYECFVDTSNRWALTDGPTAGGDCFGSGVNSFRADVWYTVTAPCTGKAIVEMCDAAMIYDSMLGVFGDHTDNPRCPQTGPDNEDLLYCNDTYCGCDSSGVSWGTTEGAVYILRLGGWSNSGSDDNASQGETRLHLGFYCGQLLPDPPGLPDDPTHRVEKNRYISVNPQTDPTTETVLKVEVAEMWRCQNAPTRGCTTYADCDVVCDDSAGPKPWYTLKSPPANCIDLGWECIDSGPCVDLAPTFDPPPAWFVQQSIQDPTGGCKSPGCPPYPPWQDNCCEDDDWMAYLGPTVPDLTGEYTSWADVWADLPAGVLHITGCGIVPATTYNVYACDLDHLDVCSEPLRVGTARFPVNARPTAFPLYADVCGGTQLPGPTVLPPDGYVSVKDLLVENLTIINYGSYNLPQMHMTWADLHGSGTGIPPNYNLGVADLMAVYVFGLVNSHPYVNTQGGLDPQDCP
jgi:hypothetical protein